MQEATRPPALLVLALLAASVHLSVQQSAPTESKIVATAPAAQLQNGIDDINASNGTCSAFLTASTCKAVQPGQGVLADCISSLLAAADAGEAGAESVPDDCAEEVYQFYITRSKNINTNVPLAKACKADAEKLCNQTWFFGNVEGGVITCLKDNRDDLSAGCKEQLYKVQAAAANDYRADVQLATACHNDAAKLCPDVKHGGGRIQACLQEHSVQLTWDCGQELFLAEADSDDDIRLSVRLFRRCLPDKKKFCADVPPGQHAAKDCLINNWNKEGFSEACKNELVRAVEQRVRDFRLDSRLSRKCAKDISTLCGMMDEVESGDTDVTTCLQDFAPEIESEDCRAMVNMYQQLAAQDIRFDAPLADACYEDRTRLCANVPPGDARVIRCLQGQRDKLSSICRATLFDEEVRFSENIDFQYPMKEACSHEIETFCRDVPHGNARVIRCLQTHKDDKEFGKACAKEVVAFEHEAASDYRFNYRLQHACRPDIDALCKDACSAHQAAEVCGGTVLRCLTEHKDVLKSAACLSEVQYYEKMEVSDYHNDVILAAACRADVEKLCPNVAAGEGRVHMCLREHAQELSAGCKTEELRLEATEAENIELRTGLLKACAAERTAFCRGVSPGSARVFRCLAEHLGDPDFGLMCRAEVIGKLTRRQVNWKLDPMLRKACRGHVAERCMEEEKSGREGAVYHCMVSFMGEMEGPCLKELGRAVHMAFYAWTPGATITHVCDADVNALCLKGRPNMALTPGAVGACLAGALESLEASTDGSRGGTPDTRPPPGSAAAPLELSPDCRKLVDIAHPPDAKRAFESSLSVALLGSQLSRAEGGGGGGGGGIALTGWSALLGVCGLVVLLAGGAYYGWRRYVGEPDSGSTVVLKSTKGYKRVPQAGS